MAKVISLIGGGGSGGGSGFTPERLDITNPPQKQDYYVGETFQREGMTVELWYTNGAHFETEGYQVTPDGPLKESDDHVTVSYTENGKKVTAEQTISVKRKEIPAPSQRNSLTYNEEAQQPEWDNYDGEKMDKSGSESETDAGSYDVTFTCKDAYTFPNDEHQKTVSWTIARAAGSVSVEPKELELKPDQESASAQITRKGDGTLSVEGAQTVCTASIQETTLTVQSKEKASGTDTLTVKCAQSKNYEEAEAQVTVKATFTTVWGATWDGTETQEWSRTEAAVHFTDPVPKVGESSPSSPFDQLNPWKGMVESDHPQAGKVVAIPKFWYKLEEFGNGGLSLQIADGQKEGFHVSPGHMDRNDGKGERDVIYIGKYHCANDYTSKTGVTPMVNVTCPNFRTNIAALSTGQDKIVMCDEATYWSIFFLYLVEFAHWDTQKKIGYGCSTGVSAVFAMGTTDTLGYHTGAAGAAIDTGGETKYRNITGLWDNCYDWVGGVRNASDGVYIELDPSKWNDTSGGQLAGLPVAGFPTKFKVTSDAGFPIFLPTVANGSKDKASGDNWGFDGGSPCVFRGGDYSRYDNHGLFYRSYNSVSYAYGNRGSRLLVLPLKGEGMQGEGDRSPLSPC